MAKTSTLWTPGFLLLNLQFMLVTCATAMFFPFQAYLGQLGLGPRAAGWIIGADGLASLLMQVLASALIHPGSARRWLAAGALAFGAALWLESRLTGFAPLLAARLLQGAGFSCVISALVTLIVQSIPPGMSGQAFGWISLVRLVPYAAVPPLFDWLGVPPAAFGSVLETAALLALAPLAMLAWRPHGAPAQAGTEAPGMKGFRSSLRQPPVAALLCAGLLLYAGYAVAFFYLRELGAALGVRGAGMFFTIASVTMMAARLLGGWLFDRFDKRRISVAGFVLIAAAYALLPAAAQPALFFGLAFAAGLGWGVVMPLQSALMFDLSEPAARGLNQNLLLVTMQAGFFCGPVAAGALLGRAGFGGLFAGAALATLLAAAATARSRGAAESIKR